MAAQDKLDGGGAPSVSARVAKGSAWIISARLLMKFIGVVNTIIVARILVPGDFGLVIIAVAALQMVQGFTFVGIAQTVVKFRIISREDFDTLFTINFIRGLVIALILMGIGSLSGRFYDDDRLTLVFIVIAIFPILQGLMNPRFYEFERDLDFSKEFIVGVSDKLVSVGVSVSLAFLFKTYWALILGLIGGGFVQTIVSYIVRPYQPRLTLVSWRRLLGFSGWLTGISMVVSLNNKLDSFVLARFIGLPATGIYTLGAQLSGLVTSELADPIARAIYPGLSEMQGDGARMQQAFLQGISAVAAVALPAAFGVAFVTDDVVVLILGDKWEGTKIVLQYLAPALGFQAMLLSTQYYAMARDKARLVFLREILFSMVKIPCFIWVCAAYGFVGAVKFGAVLYLFHAVLQLFLYGQVASDHFWRPLYVARRSLLAVLAMGLWFLWLRDFVEIIQSWPIFLRLFVDISFGAILYCGAHGLLWFVEGCPYGIETRITTIITALLVRGGVISRGKP